MEDGFWAIKAGPFACDRQTTDDQSRSQCLRALSGQKLSSVKLCEDAQIFSAEFDLGGVITISAQAHAAGSDQWLMFTAGEGVLAYNDEEGFLIEIS